MKGEILIPKTEYSLRDYGITCEGFFPHWKWKVDLEHEYLWGTHPHFEDIKVWFDKDLNTINAIFIGLSCGYSEPRGKESPKKFLTNFVREVLSNVYPTIDAHIEAVEKCQSILQKIKKD